MYTLLADTSSEEVALAVFKGNEKISERREGGERRYNKIIIGMTLEMLESCGLKPADIGVFASSLGPGYFTGIRVGLAVMKGFAHALGAKFFGATSLAILANSAENGGYIYPVISAGRDEFYIAGYEKKKGIIKKTASEALLSAGGLEKHIKKPGTVVILEPPGKNFEIPLKNAKIKVEKKKNLEMAAFNELVRAGKPSKAAVFTAAPVYIRKTQAELKRKQ